MKKLLVLLMGAMFFSGCTEKVNPKLQSLEHTQEDVSCQTDYEHNKDEMWGSMDYAIRERDIDSCSYIIVFGCQGISVTHKHNCKFCKSRNN